MTSHFSHTLADNFRSWVDNLHKAYMWWQDVTDPAAINILTFILMFSISCETLGRSGLVQAVVRR